MLRRVLSIVKNKITTHQIRNFIDFSEFKNVSGKNRNNIWRTYENCYEEYECFEYCSINMKDVSYIEVCSSFLEPSTLKFHIQSRKAVIRVQFTNDKELEKEYNLIMKVLNNKV